MTAVILEKVESQISNRFPFLRFTPDIEALFLKDYAAARVRLLVIWGLVGILIYDLIYFADRAMVHDVLTELTILRLAVFTPFVICCIVVVRRWPVARLYDLLSIAVAVLAVTLPMAAAVNSTSSYLLVYQNYNSAVFLFFTIALRPRFRSLLAGLALMCLSHFVAAHLSGAFDPVTYGGIVSFYVTLSIFLAVGAYFLEAADRRNFLNRLRASLLYRQLESNAERDELTGLLNRRSLTRISGEIWNGPAGQSAVSAILLDIDHFKKFNDAHGHIEGDACIRTVAQCIRDTVDAASFVFRFGGEEILVLSCEQTPQQGLAAAEKIRAAIEGLKLRHNGISNLGAGKGYVTASLGVASALPAQTTLEKLLQKADDALYEAKGGGRNMVGLADGPNIRAEVA